MRLIKRFESVVHSRTIRAVIMNPVERITHVQTVTVFITTGIQAVVIRHHVCAIEKLVAYAHIPLPHLEIKLAAAREDIMSHKDPVVLHGLEPSETHRELLHVHPAAEIEFHIRIQQDIVNHSPRLSGACEMIHVCSISHVHDRSHMTHPGRENHEFLFSGISRLAHPVASDFPICLRTIYLQEKSLEIIVIKPEGIREKCLRVRSFGCSTREDSGIHMETCLCRLLFEHII